MITCRLWPWLLVLILATSPIGAHQGGPHPTGLDECDDIRLALAWFHLFGNGVERSREQDMLEAQEFTISNEAPDGYTPKATVKLAWAIGDKHITRYDDFILHVRIGQNRSATYPGNDIVSQWTINPYVDGWSGTMVVTLTHLRCPFSLRAVAHWSFGNPCGTCPTRTCPAETRLGSVDVRIPVGITNHGRSPVHLGYYATDLANAGLANLTLVGRTGERGAVVNRSGDRITSVTTGDYHAVVVADPAPEDPNRFRVEVSTDPDNPADTIYRQAIVENITREDGSPALRYTETVEGHTNTRVFSRPDPVTWVLEENQLRRTTRTTLSETATTRTRRFVIEEKNAAGVYTATSVREETETLQTWGWEKTREVLDPDGKALTTTWDYYDQDDVSAPDGSVVGRGSLHSVTFPTGRTRSYEYYDTNPLDPAFSRLVITRDAFAGTPGLWEQHRHTTVPSSGVTLNERVETWIDGIMVGHTEIAASAPGGSAWRTETRYPGDGGPPQTTRFEHDSNPNSLVERTTSFPDGTIEMITGRYAGGVHASSIYRGAGNPDAYGLPIIAGTEERTVIGDAGQILESGSYHVSGGTAFRLEERFAASLDALSRPTAVDVFHGSQSAPAYTETTEYGCCGVATRTGHDGIPRHFFYDGLGRLRKTHRNGLATETIYDGLTTRTHVYPESVASPLSLASAATEAASVTRNLAGDVTSETARSPHDHSLVSTTVQTTYNPGHGIGRRVVRTLPATPDDLGVAATITEESWLDDRPASRTGPLVADQVVTYGVNAAGITSTTSRRAADGTTYQPITTQFDWLSRPISRTYATDTDGDGQPDRESLAYDPGGRLVRQVDPDGVTRLWDHDFPNETTLTAIDLDRNGVIDPATDEFHTTRAGAGINAHNQVIVWSEDLARDATGGDTPVLRSEIRADRLESWEYAYAGGHGALTHSLTTFLPGIPGTWDTTVRLPDQTSVTQRVRDGLLAEDEALDAVGDTLAIRRYQYDSYQRLLHLDDSSAPDLHLGYVGPLVDAVATRQVGSRLSTFTYDHRGHLIVVDEPDSVDAAGNPVDNRRRTAFWPHGAPREVTGTPGYRLSYTYDDALRLSTLTTFGSAPTTTRWEYDPDRGWLIAKRFNSPSPGQGDGPVFTYTGAGRLETRTSPRGIVTNHAYGPDGRLARTDYSDGTPSTVILARDRRGRIARLADGGGERTVTYTNLSAQASVTYQPGHLLAGWSILQSRDAIQRLSGLTLRSGETGHHHTEYLYDDAGRLDSVQADNLTAFYHYDPDHGRVRQLSINTTRGPVLYGNRSYDPLQRLERVSYHNGDLHGSLHVFSDQQSTRDPFGRVTTTTLRDGTQWRYAYHPSGELASAHRFSDASGSTRVPGHSRTWTYDGIGNRTSSLAGGDPTGSGLRSSEYTPNALNQFTAIQRPGAAEVFGEATPDAEVTVNGSTAARHGPFFHHELTTDNTAGPVWQEVTITSEAASHSGHLVIPGAFTTPAYDADGNLTHDGLHEYSWDAENRLVAAETTPAATAAGIPYALITYIYDSDSRLLQRLHFDAPTATIPAQSTRFLHAGWRCLGELDAAGQLTRTLAWGLDNRDTLHLGDGNGALLWIHDQPSGHTRIAHSDGRGNVTGLASAQSGQESAHYLYSPFGQVLAATGPDAQDNPYRFSTHFQDPHTDLIHYGHRHLQPDTGTWTSRDPLGEHAGPNLYNFVQNNPVNHFDHLGLALYAFDGTGNIPEQRTHITELVSSYRGDVSYLSGVGTKNAGDAMVGGLTGAGGKEKIEKMYQRFVENYANGDTEIDIIGFSRGAALARHFANVLYERGFTDPKTGKCKPVTIRFIGLFDTVGSFGNPGDHLNLGYDLDIPANVKMVAHAVAKDEKRPLFLLTPLNKPRSHQIFFEKTFTGDHSDIGGGHNRFADGALVVGNNLLSQPPLQFVHFGGKLAEAPFGELPNRRLLNSTQPHDLSGKPLGIIGPLMFGEITKPYDHQEPRNLPLGYTKW